jgi:hypothetical protein
MIRNYFETNVSVITKLIEHLGFSGEVFEIIMLVSSVNNIGVAILFMEGVKSFM